MGSEEAKKKQAPPPAPVAAAPANCPVCGKKSAKMHFCQEHFMWFKAGLVNRRGEKPSDFDKKYQSFLRKEAKTA